MDKVTSTIRKWGMLCHLGALLAYVGIPLGNLVGPLVFWGLWRLKNQKAEFVDRQGKNSLNFQISIMIYQFVSLVIFVLSLLVLRSIDKEVFYTVGDKIFIGICWVTFGISVAAIAGLLILNIFQIIKAGLKAFRGEDHQYPLSIGFIK